MPPVAVNLRCKQLINDVRKFIAGAQPGNPLFVPGEVTGLSIETSVIVVV